MLATAIHLREPTTRLLGRDHPVQQRIHAALAELTGLPLGADVRGIDGCSVPNWAMPLSAMARTFARFVTGEGLDGGAPARRSSASLRPAGATPSWSPARAAPTRS